MWGEPMDRATRANLRRLGFTSREIEAIDQEQKEFRATTKPREVLSQAERARRYRARLKASRDGVHTPGWARRRGYRGAKPPVRYSTDVFGVWGGVTFLATAAVT